MRKSLFSVNISNSKKHIKNYQKNTVLFIDCGGCTVGLVSPRTNSSTKGKISSAQTNDVNALLLRLFDSCCFSCDETISAELADVVASKQG